MERASARPDLRDGPHCADSRNAAAPDPSSTATSPPAAKPDPLAEIHSVFATIRAAASRYAGNLIDTASLRARQAVLRTALLLAGALLLFLVAGCGVVLILVGGAQALAQAFDAPLWVGLLIVGVIAIAAPAIAVKVALSAFDRQSLERARLRVAQRAATKDGASHAG